MIITSNIPQAEHCRLLLLLSKSYLLLFSLGAKDNTRSPYEMMFGLLGKHMGWAYGQQHLGFDARAPYLDEKSIVLLSWKIYLEKDITCRDEYMIIRWSCAHLFSLPFLTSECVFT